MHEKYVNTLLTSLSVFNFYELDSFTVQRIGGFIGNGLSVGLICDFMEFIISTVGTFINLKS